MKPHLQFKVLTLTASLIACLSMSTGAQANAYAVATNNVINGAGFVGVDSDGDGIPDSLGPITVGSPSATSSSSATLGAIGSPATGGSGSDSTSTPDAPASNGTGSAPARTNEDTFVSGGGNTYYNLFGELATSYSSGDAIVVSEQVSLGTFIEARNMAETNISGSGHGDADGRNISTTTITLQIILGEECDVSVDCAMSFSFEADPYMKALLDATAPLGSIARATLAFNIDLKKSGDLASTFIWAPDGSVGTGIVGGTELADAESLNGTEATQTAGATEEFSATYGSDGFGSYFAYTDYLSSGEYTLSLSMIEKTDATRQVPEPATLALLGMSLMGFGFARRKQS